MIISVRAGQEPSAPSPDEASGILNDVGGAGFGSLIPDSRSLPPARSSRPGVNELGAFQERREFRAIHSFDVADYTPDDLPALSREAASVTSS